MSEGGIYLIVRDCAGGVVLYGDSVFLLKNEKNEWVLPKGRIRDGKISSEVALERVSIETGLDATIISPAGETSYQFFSATRRAHVCNRIIWYIMHAKNDNYKLNKELQFTDGKFFSIDEALKTATFEQEKSLISYGYKKYKMVNKGAFGLCLGIANGTI
jgi:8-oxo-dGTP pyrophosphatase MutT (NUDIX family)